MNRLGEGGRDDYEAKLALGALVGVAAANGPTLSSPMLSEVIQ
jgi:hypothetical protein